MSYRIQIPRVSYENKLKIFDGSKIEKYYNYLNKKQDGHLEKYSKPFYGLYNNRCVYCGYLYTSISDTFDIEHVIEKNPITGKVEKKHDLNNLVLSCKFCNQNKRKIGSLIDKLHPDNELEEYFYRDDKFKVQINSQYEKDKYIINMHENIYNYDKIQYRYAIEKYENKLKENNLSNDERNILNNVIEFLKDCR